MGSDGGVGAGGVVTGVGAVDGKVTLSCNGRVVAFVASGTVPEVVTPRRPTAKRCTMLCCIGKDSLETGADRGATGGKAGDPAGTEGAAGTSWFNKPGVISAWDPST